MVPVVQSRKSSPLSPLIVSAPARGSYYLRERDEGEHAREKSIPVSALSDLGIQIHSKGSQNGATNLESCPFTFRFEGGTHKLTQQIFLEQLRHPARDIETLERRRAPILELLGLGIGTGEDSPLVLLRDEIKRLSRNLASLEKAFHHLHVKQYGSKKRYGRLYKPKEGYSIKKEPHKDPWPRVLPVIILATKVVNNLEALGGMLKKGGDTSNQWVVRIDKILNHPSLRPIAHSESLKKWTQVDNERALLMAYSPEPTIKRVESTAHERIPEPFAFREECLTNSRLPEPNAEVKGEIAALLHHYQGLESCRYDEYPDKPFLRSLSSHVWNVIRYVDYYSRVARLVTENGFAFATPAQNPGLMLKEFRSTTVLSSPPRNLALDKTSRCLIVTSPIFSGSSLLLKDVGMTVMYHLAGLPVPASSESSIGFYDRIYSCIPSSEQVRGEMGNFATGVTKLVSFANTATHRDLILVDQIPRGSSVVDQAATTIALLESIIARDIHCIATTKLPIVAKELIKNESVKALSLTTQRNAKKECPTYEVAPGITEGSRTLDALSTLSFPPSLVKRTGHLANNSSPGTQQSFTPWEKHYSLDYPESDAHRELMLRVRSMAAYDFPCELFAYYTTHENLLVTISGKEPYQPFHSRPPNYAEFYCESLPLPRYNLDHPRTSRFDDFKDFHGAVAYLIARGEAELSELVENLRVLTAEVTADMQRPRKFIFSGAPRKILEYIIVRQEALRKIIAFVDTLNIPRISDAFRTNRISVNNTPEIIERMKGLISSSPEEVDEFAFSCSLSTLLEISNRNSMESLKFLDRAVGIARSCIRNSMSLPTYSPDSSSVTLSNALPSLTHSSSATSSPITFSLTEKDWNMVLQGPNSSGKSIREWTLFYEAHKAVLGLPTRGTMTIDPRVCPLGYFGDTSPGCQLSSVRRLNDIGTLLEYVEKLSREGKRVPLVCLDEVDGDPLEIPFLERGILEELHSNKALVVFNTHMGDELKKAQDLNLSFLRTEVSTSPQGEKIYRIYPDNDHTAQSEGIEAIEELLTTEQNERAYFIREQLLCK